MQHHGSDHHEHLRRRKVATEVWGGPRAAKYPQARNGYLLGHSRDCFLPYANRCQTRQLLPLSNVREGARPARIGYPTPVIPDLHEQPSGTRTATIETNLEQTGRGDPHIDLALRRYRHKPGSTHWEQLYDHKRLRLSLGDARELVIALNYVLRSPRRFQRSSAGAPELLPRLRAGSQPHRPAPFPGGRTSGSSRPRLRAKRAPHASDSCTHAACVEA